MPWRIRHFNMVSVQIGGQQKENVSSKGRYWWWWDILGGGGVLSTISIRICSVENATFRFLLLPRIPLLKFLLSQRPPVLKFLITQRPLFLKIINSQRSYILILINYLHVTHFQKLIVMYLMLPPTCKYK